MCFTGCLIPSPYPLPEGEGKRKGRNQQLGCFGVSALRARIAIPIVYVSTSPLRSGTLGFPESGSDLGVPFDRLPTMKEAQVLTHIHPSSYVFFPKGVLLFIGPTCPATPRTAKCPEPLHTQKALPVMSCTTSAGIPPLSSLLQAHAPVLHPPAALVSPWAAGLYGRCQPRLGVGPSRRYLQMGRRPGVAVRHI